MSSGPYFTWGNTRVSIFFRFLWMQIATIAFFCHVCVLLKSPTEECITKPLGRLLI